MGHMCVTQSDTFRYARLRHCSAFFGDGDGCETICDDTSSNILGRLALDLHEQLAVKIPQ